MSYRDRLSKLEQDLSDTSSSSDKWKIFLPYVVLTIASFVIVWLASPSFLKEKRHGSKVKVVNSFKFGATVIVSAGVLSGIYYMYGSTLLSKYWK
jgi:uncharacterized membrane protein (DUF485 family)